jgi:uncharacterized coiled-coil protein SlyX
MTDTERITELENKISYQDVAIEELHAASIEQYELIVRLQKDLKELKDRFEGATSTDHEIGPGDQKPPHY